MKIFWTSLALADIRHVRDYVALENPSAAADIVQRIGKSAAMLLQHAHLGRPGRVSGTRELVVSDTPFILAYRVKGPRIEIISVIHAARRWPANFRGA